MAAFTWPRCPDCGGEVIAAQFGPEGTVWSATVVRIPVPGRTPPYTLVYVDLDDGPRVLAHLDDQPLGMSRLTVAPPPIGARVRLLESAPDGDLRVEVLT